MDPFTPSSNSSASPEPAPPANASSLPAPSSPPRSNRSLKKLFFFILVLVIGAGVYLKQTDSWNPFSFLQRKTLAPTEAARIWVHYGTLQHHVGELPEAMAAYEQASSLDPQLYEAWWNLSLIQDSLNLPQKQLASLQQAVRCRPESPEAWASLTKIYLHLNQDREAMMARQQEEIAKRETLKEDDRETVALENPDSTEAWIQWGLSRAVYRFVQPDCFDPKTLDIFQRASGLHPHSPWIWAHLGLSSIHKRNEIPGSPFLTEVQVPDLIPFQKAAELLPRDTTLFFMLGRAALWKGEWNTAINAFQIATQSPQAHWLAWYYLGETYLAANRSDEAIAAYTKAQTLSPDSLEIQFGVAQAYIQKGMIEEAQHILDQETNPRNQIIPLTRRAFVQLALHKNILSQPTLAKKTPSSVKSFRASASPREEIILPPDPLPTSLPPPLPEPEITIQHRSPQLPLVNERAASAPAPEASETPETLNPHLNLRNPSQAPAPMVEPPSPQKMTRLLLEQNLNERSLQEVFLDAEKIQRYDLMVQAAQQLVQRNPSSKNWTTLGYAYGLHNQTEKEIDSYQKALQKDPKNRNAIFNMGLAFLQQNRITKAQASFQKITQAFPKDQESWFHLGLTYEKQERWDDACRAYQQAINITPSYGEAWLNLGGIYASIKRPDLEVETYRKCLEANPQYQPAWHNLAVVLKSIGKFEEYEATKKMIEDSTR